MDEADTDAGGVEQDSEEENRMLIQEMERMNVRIQSEGLGLSADFGYTDRDVSGDAERGGSQLETATTSSTTETTPSSTSGWSWWGRSTTSALGSTSTSPAPLKNTVWGVTNSKQAVGHKKTGSRISVASPRISVSRDGFERNLKGMNRIMGWNTSSGVEDGAAQST